MAQGVVSKRRVFDDSRTSGSLPFSRGALYHLLQNPVYRGMIVHKDKAYPGVQAAIVDQDLWDAVQAKLQANGFERSDCRKTEAPAILTGVLFGAAGGPMTPTHAVKKGVRYRDYVSRHLVTGAQSEDSGRGSRIPELRPSLSPAFAPSSPTRARSSMLYPRIVTTRPRASGRLPRRRS